MNRKRMVVTGAGGFIGHHLVTRLKADGHWVRGVDIKNLNTRRRPATNLKFATYASGMSA